MNTLDRIIGYISPGKAKLRIAERLQVEQMRKYEAAGHGRRFANGYLGRGTSANTEIERAGPLMRDRHRYMVRNNPWAARAVQAIVTNTVGFGITGDLARRGRKVPQYLKDRWADYCDKSSLVDAYGQHDLYGLQAIALRTVVESGECLAVRVRRRGMFSKVKLLEPDHLDHETQGDLPDGGRIIQGVEYNAQDEIVAYWLFPQHPGDPHTRHFKPERVPAADVLHVYRVDRPGQVRGVAWGHPVMVSLSDLDEYEDAYLFRQKLANCVTGIFEDMDPLPGQPGASDVLPADQLEPGAMLHAPPGKRVNWSTPPSAGDYGPFTKDFLLRIAAGYGVSFQAMTGDLSSVNFSSGRMGWVEFQRNLEAWRWQMFIPMFCDGVAGWWLEDAELMGANVTDLFVEWTPPRREMFDPTREGPAMEQLIRAGIKSLPSTHRELGMRTEQVLQEIADTNKLIDQFELVLDSDPRTIGKGTRITSATQADVAEAEEEVTEEAQDDETTD